MVGGAPTTAAPSSLPMPTPVREAGAGGNPEGEARFAAARALLGRLHPTWTPKQREFVLDRAFEAFVLDEDGDGLEGHIRAAAADYAKALPAPALTNQRAVAGFEVILDSGRG